MRLEDALPLLEAAFAAGAPFRFFQRGTSMLPMLRQGIDSVQLVSPHLRAPEKGEVILYRRKNGDFILHRAIGIDKNGDFIACGDNQGAPEKGISRFGIIGVLEGFYRGDEWISADDIEYKKYVKRRMRSRWIRYLKYIAHKILK